MWCTVIAAVAVGIPGDLIGASPAPLALASLLLKHPPPSFPRQSLPLRPSMSTRSKKRSGGTPGVAVASTPTAPAPVSSPSPEEDSSAAGIVTEDAPDPSAAASPPSCPVESGVVCTPAPGDASPEQDLDEPQLSPEALLAIVQPSGADAAVKGETYVHSPPAVLCSPLISPYICSAAATTLGSPIDLISDSSAATVG